MSFSLFSVSDLNAAQKRTLLKSTGGFSVGTHLTSSNHICSNALLYLGFANLNYKRFQCHERLQSSKALPIYIPKNRDFRSVNKVQEIEVCFLNCRALRVVNPSPYMIYSQARGSTLVASSPEILCKVESDGTVTNRSVQCSHNMIGGTTFTTIPASLVTIAHHRLVS